MIQCFTHPPPGEACGGWVAMNLGRAPNADGRDDPAASIWAIIFGPSRSPTLLMAQTDVDFHGDHGPDRQFKS